MYSTKITRTLVASVVMSQEITILYTTNAKGKGRLASPAVPRRPEGPE
jgi:hypothetical protein